MCRKKPKTKECSSASRSDPQAAVTDWRKRGEAVIERNEPFGLDGCREHCVQDVHIREVERVSRRRSHDETLVPQQRLLGVDSLLGIVEQLKQFVSALRWEEEVPGGHIG